MCHPILCVELEPYEITDEWMELKQVNGRLWCSVETDQAHLPDALALSFLDWRMGTKLEMPPRNVIEDLL